MTKYPSIYEFTDAGMSVFKRIFTGQLDESAIGPADPEFVIKVEGTSAIEITDFETAQDMAQAVLMSTGEDNAISFLSREGIWAWLTFVLRDQLFPRDKSGTRKFGEVHRWYPSNPNDWQKAQRHLVRMPVLLLATLKENADHLLCRHPSIGGEVKEQLTSQQDMFTPGFQAVAKALYYDPTTKDLKRGSGGKGKGSPRRLAQVRKQLDVTWELDDLDFERIMNTLPAEFDRFKEAI